ncbi:MAG: hypothetical protein K0Q59_3454, partial [Paenibacillus sp.]|nr:hypothetical protein [Paenibacillus sp.]
MMRSIIKLKWLVLFLWLAGTVFLLSSAPNMAQLVREKGQIKVPEGHSSTIAAQLLKEMNASADQAESGTNTGKSKGGSHSSVLVFHNGNGLSSSDMAEVKRGVDKLKAGKETYGIRSITTHFDRKELEKQMVAQDGKTVLVLVSSYSSGRSPTEERNALYDAVSDVKVEHYYTGDWLINEDVIQSSQDGLKKTEGITVVFILAILFIVFRSAIAPFIPLLSVGLTYVVSQAVVSFLVKYADFPLSNFTQIFLVAILFGIGTDYCILLISRFKEELARLGDITEAIVETYRTAGKTVFYSGLAVLVGFASIGLSKFVLYRSAVAVAVGVAVLMIALYTLVPFFMAVLGKAIFWPIKGSLEHKPSRIWGAAGTFSLKRPLAALAILAVVIAPFLIAYKGQITFNSMDELGGKYNSVKAFEVIADSFGPGDSMPSTVVLKTDKPMNTSEGLAAVEQISRELSKVEGVKTVRSATRPTGEVMKDFQVTEQIGAVDNGLGQSKDGLGQIGKGLSDASKALSGNSPKLNEAVQGAEQLTAGTNELRKGILALGDGLKRIEGGLREGSAGAESLAAGLSQAKASAEQLAAASRELLGGYRQVGGGLEQLTAAYGELAARQDALAEGLSGLGLGLGSLEQKYPQLKSDPDYARMLVSVGELQAGAAGLGSGLRELNAQLAGAAGGIAAANAGYEQAVAGQTALAAGLEQLARGLGELQAGVAMAANGQGQAVAQIPALAAGAGELASGQQQLQSGFKELSDQLGQLTSGLDQSVGGLAQVTGGLASAQTFLGELSDAP